MNKRRQQILDWAMRHYPRWPAPLDTTPDGPNPIEIGAEWAMPMIGAMPVLLCRLGGTGPVTSTDWFYHRIKMRAQESGDGPC